MKTYTFNDPKLGLISYVDGKRYLWLISVLFPLFPLLAMGLMNWSGQQWMLWIPLIFLYVFIPVLDYLFPNDRSNPPEQIVPQLEADIYYRVLNHLTVPLHFIILITGAWFVANNQLKCCDDARQATADDQHISFVIFHTSTLACVGDCLHLVFMCSQLTFASTT